MDARPASQRPATACSLELTRLSGGLLWLASSRPVGRTCGQGQCMPKRSYLSSAIRVRPAGLSAVSSIDASLTAGLTRMALT